MKRRELDFQSSEDVIQEINRLRGLGYQRAGQWSLTQVCQHLTATMKGGMDGFGFRFPWIMRATIAKWAFRYGLKTRKLGSGFPTFKCLRPLASGPDDDNDVIDACIDCCKRAAEFPGPISDYPLLDNVEVDQWRDFMWIHAAHHLSFLIPNEAGDASE